MANQRIAILGASGMLGTDLVIEFQSQYLDISCYDIPQFDITNRSDLKDAVSNSDVIINCAAYTNVDKAESDQKSAYSVNAAAVEELGRFAEKLGKYVIYISTDFVYDGMKKGCYTESDRPNPINAYGKSKLSGEKLLQKTGCSHCILRLEWTYGFAGINFINKICRCIDETHKISVVSDQIGSPTSTKKVASAISELVNNRQEGLFLYAANGYASRFEIAEFIVQNLDITADVIPCSTRDFPTPAKRPLNSKFDCSKIDSVLSFKRPYWQLSLHKFLEDKKCS